MTKKLGDIMRKLSIQLGCIFFIIIVGLEVIMFLFLHTTIVHSKINEEELTLQAKGDSLVSILEKHFDSETIAHIMLMESETETDVIITDTNNNIIASSNSLLNKYVDSQISERTTNEDFLVGNWKDDDFIFTVNAIGNNGKEVGLVYTFQNTDKIHILVKKLNENFFFVGVFTLILTFIVITFLSYALAKPLVKMKEATSKIIEGDFSISLPNIKNEELGDLSKSITRLAKDLNYLQLERKGFLDSISHELKTPLTLIKGYADIIYNRELSDEEK
ncbi:two-component sensor histidine kinase, partial [Bacillus sp. CRN 9]|nr:two-component sensor histidine kinase [Bacillus sp. CRN 9]